MKIRIIILAVIIVVLAVQVSCRNSLSISKDLTRGWTYGAEYLGSDSGTRFVLHAPSADTVYISGDFNSWDKTPMFRDGDNFWIELGGAEPGHSYKYRSSSFAGEWIADPFSRLLTSDSDENSLIQDPAGPAALYSWGDSSWVRPDLEELVIYEMHVIDYTWNDRSGPAPGVSPGNQGTFAGVGERIDYLSTLGVNAVQFMPVQDWPGGYYSWGYNPSLYWAIEASLGSGSGSTSQVLLEFKELVDALHQEGIAVILDVVYNHVDASSPLERINEASYMDGDTPWGPRLNLKNDFVYNYVRDNLIYFMNEFHIDGFRFDSTENSDSSAMINLVDDLYTRGYDDRYFIFEEFDGNHNAAIQTYNETHGEARIASWGTGYKDGVYAAMQDAGYDSLGNLTYHSNNNGWDYAASALSYASSHDEGTLFYHASAGPHADSEAAPKTLALTVLTHKFTSLGVPMFWMGDELMRDHRGNAAVTVTGIGSGVDVENNQMDWSGLMAANSDSLAYVQNFLALRSAHSSIGRAMSQPDTASGAGDFSDGFMWNTDWADGFIGWIRAVAGDRPFAVFVNYGDSQKVYTASFPQDGTWTLVADSSVPAASGAGTSVGAGLAVSSGEASITVPANAALVFMGPANF